MHKAAKHLTTINKKTAIEDDTEKPAFESRRTLENHVQDNMQCAGREFYHQRIIFIAKYKISDIQNEKDQTKMKPILCSIIDRLNETLETEKLSGLLLDYSYHSLSMLEGPEEYIAKVMGDLAKETVDIFEKSKVVLVYNNSNQVMTILYYIHSYKINKKTHLFLGNVSFMNHEHNRNVSQEKNLF